MENESQKKLDDLPPTKSDYWEHADVYVREMTKVNACEHYFEYIEGTAKCKKCGVGFFLDADDTLKEGHLYREGKLVL